MLISSIEVSRAATTFRRPDSVIVDAGWPCGTIEIEPSPLTFLPKTLEWSELEDVIMDALDTAHHGAEPITLDDGVPDMVAIACITVNALKDAGIVVEG